MFIKKEEEKKICWRVNLLSYHDRPGAWFFVFMYAVLHWCMFLNFRGRMTQIAVDWQVHAGDGRYYDVIFVGTGEFIFYGAFFSRFKPRCFYYMET